MLCHEYKYLIDAGEESVFNAKLLHCIKSESAFFHVARSIIEEGARNGLFDKVKFGNVAINEKPTDNTELQKDI